MKTTSKAKLNPLPAMRGALVQMQTLVNLWHVIDQAESMFLELDPSPEALETPEHQLFMRALFNMRCAASYRGMNLKLLRSVPKAAPAPASDEIDATEPTIVMDEEAVKIAEGWKA